MNMRIISKVGKAGDGNEVPIIKSEVLQIRAKGEKKSSSICFLIFENNTSLCSRIFGEGMWG